MRILTLRTAAIALVAGLGLGGCAYGPYGSYGGLGVGYGNGYYDPYYGGGYYGAGYSRYGSGYGYGYGAPYYGWYDGFYYPGTGYYVYDRYRRPHRWSDTQRRYWESRRNRYHRGDSPTNHIIQNWADFQNGPRAKEQRVVTNRTIRNRDVSTQQRINTERARTRSEAQQARAQARSERQQPRSRGLHVRNSRKTHND